MNQGMERRSRLVLGLVLLIVGLSAAQLAYRFTLPTDGWDVLSGDIGSAEQDSFMLWADLVGLPSGLQSGDWILAVDGTPVDGIGFAQKVSPPENWQAGQQVTYTVRRGAATLDVAVTLGRWTLDVWSRRQFGSSYYLAGGLGALILFGIALFTFFKRPDQLSAHMLLVLSTAYLANGLSGSLPDGLSASFDPAARQLSSFFSNSIFIALIAPSLLAFALVFPRPKQAIARRGWLAFTPFMVAAIIWIGLQVSRIAALGWIGTLLMIAGAILSLVHSGLTARDAVSRAQLRWAVGGVVLGLALSLLSFPAAFGWVPDWLGPIFGAGIQVGFTLMGVSLAIAILRYRLFDIDVIIRRTLVYGVLTGALGLVYFGGVTLLQDLFARVTGEASTFAIVLSTLAIAALFNPLRGRIQGFIDSRFYRQRYDAAQTMAAFNRTAREEVDLDELSQALLAVVEKTMQPEAVALWVKKPER